jgi:hypothetical protein
MSFYCSLPLCATDAQQYANIIDTICKIIFNISNNKYLLKFQGKHPHINNNFNEFKNMGNTVYFDSNYWNIFIVGKDVKIDQYVKDVNSGLATMASKNSSLCEVKHIIHGCDGKFSYDKTLSLTFVTTTYDLQHWDARNLTSDHGIVWNFSLTHKYNNKTYLPSVIIDLDNIFSIKNYSWVPRLLSWKDMTVFSGKYAAGCHSKCHSKMAFSSAIHISADLKIIDSTRFYVPFTDFYKKHRALNNIADISESYVKGIFPCSVWNSPADLKIANHELFMEKLIKKVSTSEFKKKSKMDRNSTFRTLVRSFEKETSNFYNNVNDAHYCFISRIPLCKNSILVPINDTFYVIVAPFVYYLIVSHKCVPEEIFSDAAMFYLQNSHIPTSWRTHKQIQNLPMHITLDIPYLTTLLRTRGMDKPSEFTSCIQKRNKIAKYDTTLFSRYKSIENTTFKHFIYICKAIDKKTYFTPSMGLSSPTSLRSEFRERVKQYLPNASVESIDKVSAVFVWHKSKSDEEIIYLGVHFTHQLPDWDMIDLIQSTGYQSASNQSIIGQTQIPAYNEKNIILVPMIKAPFSQDFQL